MQNSEAVLEQFSEWLSSKKYRDHAIGAHDLRSYEVMKQVMEHKTQPLDLGYQKAKTNAQDTLNFVQQRLASFRRQSE